MRNNILKTRGRTALESLTKVCKYPEKTLANVSVDAEPNLESGVLSGWEKKKKKKKKIITIKQIKKNKIR